MTTGVSTIFLKDLLKDAPTWLTTFELEDIKLQPTLGGNTCAL